MAKFKGEIKKCLRCGNEFKVPQCRAKEAKYCSQKCHYEDERPSAKIWRLCERCGKPFQTWPAWERKGSGKYCSFSCYNDVPKKPHFGEENSNWKGGRTLHSGGYVYVASAGHPFRSNGAYVFEHRLVMEEYLKQNDPHNKALIEIGGNLYLSPDYDVHHRDENRQNNKIENLLVLTKSDHKRLHESLKKGEQPCFKKK